MIRSDTISPVAVFGWVEFWPSSGWEDRLWTDDAPTDALVRSARRVAEAYSGVLRAERIEGPATSLPFFTHLYDGDEVGLAVDTDRPLDWESGAVMVPAAVADLSADDRGRLVLDLIHDAVVQLGPHRGWSTETLDGIRERVLAQGFGGERESPWKASPDRSLAVRMCFRWEDDGFGRVVIEVRDRKSEQLVARSEPWLTHGFRHSVKTLRWRGRIVEFVPQPTYIGDTQLGEVVHVDPAQGEIHVELPAARVESLAPVPPIVRCPYKVESPTPGVEVFMGFGVGLRASSTEGWPDGTAIERGLFDRIHAPEGQSVKEWLDERSIEAFVEYFLPAQLDGRSYGIRVRRVATRVTVDVIRDGTALGGKDLPQSVVDKEVGDIVDQVMAVLDSRISAASRRSGSRPGRIPRGGAGR